MRKTPPAILEEAVEPAVDPVEAPAPPPSPRTARQIAFDACDVFVSQLEALAEKCLKGDDPVLLDARREVGRMANAFGADLSRLYGYIPVGNRPKE